MPGGGGGGGGGAGGGGGRAGGGGVGGVGVYRSLILQTVGFKKKCKKVVHPIVH